MKNRRINRKKIKLRSSTRTFYIIIALVLFAFSSNNIIQETILTKTEEKSKKEIYTYTNNYSSSYDMNVKKNKFIEEKTLPMGQTYVTDLIDSMDLHINYSYQASKNSDVRYVYNITATIGASYTDNGKEYKVWDKKYILLDSKQGESNGNFNINELVKVDLYKYNKEVNDFKQTMGMSLDAYLNIQINVETITNIGNKEVKNNYSSDCKLTLGSKIINVNSKDNDVKVGHVEEEYTIKNSASIMKLSVNILLLVASVYLIYFIYKNTRTVHSVKNEYKLELNRILKSCQEKIIVLNKKIETDESNIVDVRDFGELIKLSEELCKPVLYWNSEDEQEAWFSVISNSVTYRFILKKY